MIQFTENYALSSDDICVTVSKRHVFAEDTKAGKKGEVWWEKKWHFNNYIQALDNLVDREIGNVDASSFEEVVEHIKKTKAEILEALKELRLNYAKEVNLKYDDYFWRQVLEGKRVL